MKHRLYESWMEVNKQIGESLPPGAETAARLTFFAGAAAALGIIRDLTAMDETAAVQGILDLKTELRECVDDERGPIRRRTHHR